MKNGKNEIILFENQNVKLEVNLKEETVWLTQAQMEVLFDVKHTTISEHINNIFREGELDEKSSVGISARTFLIWRTKCKVRSNIYKKIYW